MKLNPFYRSDITVMWLQVFFFLFLLVEVSYYIVYEVVLRPPPKYSAAPNENLAFHTGVIYGEKHKAWASIFMFT